MKHNLHITEMTETVVGKAVIDQIAKKVEVTSNQIKDMILSDFNGEICKEFIRVVRAVIQSIKPKELQDLIKEAGMYKLTEKAPLNAIVQFTQGGGVYDLSAYGSREEAWEGEKTESWVAGVYEYLQAEMLSASPAESEAVAEAEFKATVHEYSRDEILSAAENDEAWPLDFGYVEEV